MSFPWLSERVSKWILEKEISHEDEDQAIKLFQMKNKTLGPENFEEDEMLLEQ